MKSINLKIWCFFFFLGIISITSQAILLREISILFYGSETFYCLGLATWLLFTGLGSLFGQRLRFLKKKSNSLWLTQAGLLVYIPIAIIILRWLSSKIFTVGELPSFGLSLLFLVITLFPFCFFLGKQFSTAVENLSGKDKKDAVNSAYFYETIGFVFGGLFFSFILGRTSFPLWSKINLKSLGWRYPNLVTTLNTKYSQLIITKKGEQFNFFVDGQLTFTIPENFDYQQLLSLITPYSAKTAKVLILGNPNLAIQIKKLNPEKVDFVELDHNLLELEKNLMGTNVNLVSSDPRVFLHRESPDKYDLIIFSPGIPQTLLTNRYYTKECFESVRDRLSKNGIFALVFYFPTDYQSKEALLFGSSIYQTLKMAFPNLELLTPEDQLLFIASNSKINIFEDKLNPFFAKYFQYQINNSKRFQILKSLSDAKSKLNTDFEPSAFFYQQLFWQTMFSFTMPKIAWGMVNILPIFLLLIFLYLQVKSSKKARLASLAMVSSLILMSLEILIIFIFQSKIGALHSQITLIFALVLLGISVGVRIKKYFPDSQKFLNFNFVGYLILLVFLFQVPNSRISEFSFIWFSLALAIGLIGGAIFSSINCLYFANFLKNSKMGFIYSFDLFGAFLGSILTTIFLLPYFGFRNLILLLFLLVLFYFISIKIIAKHQED